MECYNCGMEIPADATTCPRCGARFAPRTADAQSTGSAAPSRGRWPTWLGIALVVGVIVMIALLWLLLR